MSDRAPNLRCMARTSGGVRPTRRALTDLDHPVPHLGVPLDEIDHVVVRVSQMVPIRREAGGADRILALKDRVWLKVKVSDQRAVVTELANSERGEDYAPSVGNWWIGAAGRRQADSPQRDFYDSITRECTVGKTVSSVGLLPTEWDWKRLTAEQAIEWRREMKRIVIRLITMSIISGKPAVAEFRRHRLKALVQSDNGHEAYLAIIAEGIPNPEVFALLLDCVPGVSPEDWQPEPSALAEMEPAQGEIIWSTLFPTEVADAILQRGD